MEEPKILNKRYQLLDPLGKGGMAFVYRARDLMLERLVAVKVLREDFSRDPAFQERFRQEARAAANLSHPTLVYAHRAGLVHCDVKPQNMLVTPDMRLKVADFGIARALAAIHPDELNDVVWGSPQYFAPEQASGAAPSPASDVYSLGIIMYEMLTSSLPFQATTTIDLARLHVEADPPLLSELIADISPTLEQILGKVLSKEPSQRYRTADQLGRVLLNFGNARSAPALSLTPEAASILLTTPASAPAPGIDWATLGLGLAALAAVLGLIPFWTLIWFAYNPPIR
jgi:serine/threonine protein kinase